MDVKMPPVFCISVDPEREAKAREHFMLRGMEVTFIKGIDAPKWGLSSTVVFEPKRDATYIIHPKQVGNNLSHWMLWQYLQLVGIPEALIFEDDAELVDDFVEKFHLWKQQLPEDWQFVYIGYLEGPETIARKTERIVARNVIRANELFGTHCYLVNQSGICVLMKHSAVAWAPLDIQIYERCLPYLNHYAFSRPLAGQLNCSPSQMMIRSFIVTASEKLSGWCPKEKMIFLFDSCKAGDTYVEVGVYAGRSFLSPAAAVGEEGRAYAIDPWTVEAAIDGETQKVQRDWWIHNSEIERRRLEFLQAVKDNNIERQTKIMRMTSMEAVVQFGDETIDTLHIDGNHPKAEEDIKGWMPKVKPGGLFVVDDTDHGGWPQIERTIPWILERTVEIHHGDNYRVFRKLQYVARERTEEAVDPLQHLTATRLSV